MVSRIPAIWRCVYTTPLAGPVEPEVNSTAASASGSTAGISSGDTVVTESISSGTVCATPSSFLDTGSMASAAMRVPGQPRARAPTRALRMPMNQRGEEPRSARVSPWRPRPWSATTITAPMRRHA